MEVVWTLDCKNFDGKGQRVWWKKSKKVGYFWKYYQCYCHFIGQQVHSLDHKDTPACPLNISANKKAELICDISESLEPCIDSVTTWAGWICAALRSSRQSSRSFAALTSWLWTGANTTCRKTVGLVGSTLGTWARRHVSSPELPSSHPPGAFSTWPFLSLLVKVDSSTLPVDQGVFNVIHADWKKTNIPWYPLSIWEQKKTRQSFIRPASQMWVHMSPASS